MYKVLIIATSRKTRGGITSVIESHQKGKQWKEFNCKWIETHIDKNFLWKLIYFIKSFILYVILIPSYQIIHIHVSEPPSAIRKCIFMWWAKLWQKKTIVHFHSFSSKTTIKSKKSFLYSYLFENANKVIVLSQYWEKEVNDIFKLGSKIEVLYNPCSTPSFKSSYKRRKHILFAGTLNKRKGYNDLIVAFSKIAPLHPDWKIIFAGNGDIENGKRQATKTGIEKQVCFLGWINGKNKHKAYMEASIFCLPSYAEGLPMAVLDACSYGIPIISTYEAGLSEFGSNQNLILFNAGDTEHLGRILNMIINDIDLRKRLSSSSLNLSKTIFKEDVINEKIGIIYKSILT